MKFALQHFHAISRFSELCPFNVKPLFESSRFRIKLLFELKLRVPNSELGVLKLRVPNSELGVFKTLSSQLGFRSFLTSEIVTQNSEFLKLRVPNLELGVFKTPSLELGTRSFKLRVRNSEVLKFRDHNSVKKSQHAKKYLIEEYYENQFNSLKSMKKKFRRKYKIYRQSFLLKNFWKYF